MILQTATGSVALSPSSAAALCRIAMDQGAGRHPNAAAFHTVALEPLYEAGLVGRGADGRLALATMPPADMLAALDLAGHPVLYNCKSTMEPVYEPEPMAFVPSGFLLGVNKAAPQYRLVRAADGSGGPLYETYEWTPLGTMAAP